MPQHLPHEQRIHRGPVTVARCVGRAAAFKQVLRRLGGAGDEKSGRIPHEEIPVEGGHVLEERIHLMTQHFPILRILESPPVMERHHRARAGPDVPAGGGHVMHLPDVARKVVCATAAVVVACGALRSLAVACQQGEKRLNAFRQPPGLRRPVIHAEIDVRAEVTVPGRADFLAPDTLQVGRLIAGAGTGEQQVSRVVVVKGKKRGVALAGPQPSLALFDGELRQLGRSVQLELEAVIQRLVFPDVSPQ